MTQRLMVALPLAIRQAKMFWRVRGPRFLRPLYAVVLRFLSSDFGCMG